MWKTNAKKWQKLPRADFGDVGRNTSIRLSNKQTVSDRLLSLEEDDDDPKADNSPNDKKSVSLNLKE